MSFERSIDITPAYDRVSEGFGIHCCDLRVVVKNERGAVQFMAFTGWFTDSVPKKTWTGLAPMAADLGYHSPTQMYEGQDPAQESCQYLDGRPCFYDGSGLNAERPWKILREQGLEKLYEYLEEYHRQTFPDPVPTFGNRRIET